VGLGVISLLVSIRNLKEMGGGGGSGAFRSDFLSVFDKEPEGKGRGRKIRSSSAQEQQGHHIVSMLSSEPPHAHQP